MSDGSDTTPVWRPLYEWTIATGDGPQTIPVLIAGRTGDYRYRADLGADSIDAPDVSRLYAQLLSRLGGGDERIDIREHVSALEAAARDDNQRLDRGNAMVAAGLACASGGCADSLEALERSVEKQTDGKAKCGWIRTMIGDRHVSILAFRDASAVALVARPEGKARVVPVPFRLDYPFRASPDKPYKSTLIVNKEPEPGQNILSVSFDDGSGPTVVPLPAEIDDMAEPLAADLRGIALKMAHADRTLDDLPPLRRPDESDVDDGKVIRLDPAGAWLGQDGEVFYWPTWLPHRAVRLDMLDEFRGIVEAIVQMMLWAEPAYPSPAYARITTAAAHGDWKEQIGVHIPLQTYRSRGDFQIREAAQELIAGHFPGIASAIAFEAEFGGTGPTIRTHYLLKIHVERPSAAVEAHLEEEYGAPFSDYASYRAPRPEADDMPDPPHDPSAQVALASDDPAERPARPAPFAPDVSTGALSWEDFADQGAFGEEQRDLERLTIQYASEAHASSGVAHPGGYFVSERPLYAAAFLDAIEARLEKFGVALEDLVPREVPLWDPAQTLDGRTVWATRHDLSPDRLVDLQADLVTSARSRENPRNVMERVGIRTDDSVWWLTRASSGMEILGCWITAALNPLWRRPQRFLDINTRLRPAYIGPQTVDSRIEGESFFEVPVERRAIRGFNAYEASALAREMMQGADSDKADDLRWSRSLSLPTAEFMARVAPGEGHGPGTERNGSQVEFLDYLAGTIALNALTYTPVIYRSSANAPNEGVEADVRARLQRRVEEHQKRLRWHADEEARIKAMSPLQRRHHKLSSRWRSVFGPGQARVEDLGDEELVGLAARVAREPLSVYLGLTPTALRRCVGDARRRIFLRDRSEPAEIIERARAVRGRAPSFASLMPWDVVILVAAFEVDGVARRFNVQAKVVTAAVERVERRLCDLSKIAPAHRKLVHNF